MGSATDKGQREEDEPVGQQDNAADSLHSRLISVLSASHIDTLKIPYLPASNSAIEVNE